MLYNDYRPIDYNAICGQDEAMITLRKQAETGNFGQAYLMAGHRGTGKTSVSRILAKAVNCLHPSAAGPCNLCENCQAAKSSLDIMELDAASNNGVADIKELVNKTKFQPMKLPKKVFIIDEVHNLSAAAFDSLLKTIEEPPSYCVFILCTTELHKIPATITSRCELYNFHTIDAFEIKKRLQYVLEDQNATCEPDALNLIARYANGALRDALSILEQMLVSTDRKITKTATQVRLGIMDTDILFDLLSAAIKFDTQKVLEALQILLASGKSPSLITDSLLSMVTDLITVKSTEDPNSILNTEQYTQSLTVLGEQISFERLFWIAEICSDLRTSIKHSINPSMDLQLCFIKLANQELISYEPIAMAQLLKELKKEIDRLKEKVNTFSTSRQLVLEKAEEETKSKLTQDSSITSYSDRSTPFPSPSSSLPTESFITVEMEEEVMPSNSKKAESISTIKEKPNIPAFDLLKRLG